MLCDSGAGADVASRMVRRGGGWGRHRLRAAAFAIALAVGLPAGARAQDGATDPVVAIDTGQRVWRVPYRYLSIRPPPAELRPVNRWDRFSFAFWMPDLRPTVVPGHRLGWLRPLEPGRPPPGPQEYVVIVTNVGPLDAPLGVSRPERQLENWLRWQGRDRYEFRERWGLTEVTPKPGTSEDFDKYYAKRTYDDPRFEASALIRCHRADSSVRSNHICDGHVALPVLRVTFHIQLPENRMDQLLDVIGVAGHLLLGWSDAGPGAQ